MSDTGDDCARTHVVVAAVPRRAFSTFVAVGLWWPARFTWSGPTLDDMSIEPRAGGACTERARSGIMLDWGRVLAGEPPGQLVLAWHIGPGRVPTPDPDRASRAEVTFTPHGLGRCRVAVTHRGFARHGAAADAYRNKMHKRGWPTLLHHFAAAVARGR